MNSRLSKLVFLFLFSFLISSCAEQQADIESVKTYKSNGISFDYPSNWEVTDDSTDQGVRFIFIESPGAAISKIEVYPKSESFSLLEFAELDAEALLKEMPDIFNKSSSDAFLRITNDLTDEAAIEGLKFKFTISVAGIDIPHINEFYMFPSSDKIAYITNQVAIEDLAKVQTGFKSILATFSML